MATKLHLWCIRCKRVVWHALSHVSRTKSGKETEIYACKECGHEVSYIVA